MVAVHEKKDLSFGSFGPFNPGFAEGLASGLASGLVLYASGDEWIPMMGSLVASGCILRVHKRRQSCRDEVMKERGDCRM